MFYYTPIMLAKRLATMDILSQGRMICGLGWSKDEYQASNIPFMNRGERADEFIQVLKKIWADGLVLSYPNIKNDSSTNDKNRFPLTGTIDEVGR
jgi:alkanesulfonate monooxygenase SsuD/methylene tetrahydromethanopterin reductase-like flavin-dependent oxidoreductase (luciferase family)